MFPMRSRRKGQVCFWLLLGPMLLAVAGCQGGSATYGVNASPQSCESAGQYRESGDASWYGEKYHGRTTASGDRFDMNGMTAAHRTLPFGTKVRVTNRENGQSTILRVNDRGPFVEGRIIDVSRAAAEDLNFVQAGLAPVRVETIESC